jgi:hypothetical protein
MFKRVTQVLVVALTATIGIFAFAGAASAAPSVGGCAPTSIISACVNYGDHGGDIRSDFYINKRPDSDQKYYRVAIHRLTTSGGDSGMWVSPLTPIGGTGHHCCWYRYDVNDPHTYHGAKTVVYTFTANQVVHSVFTSPSIWYTS